MKDLDPFVARPRPRTGTLDVLGRRCKCRRKLYIVAAESLDAIYCRGCDEPQNDCYCPLAPTESDAVP